jgi:HTH-type transcriptional regulator/antitoxin MqsA
MSDKMSFHGTPNGSGRALPKASEVLATLDAMTAFEVMAAREIIGRGREIRVAAGLSQSVIAEDLGVTWRQVARWEAGDSTPHRRHALAYARLLKGIEKRTSRLGSRPAAGGPG